MRYVILALILSACATGRSIPSPLTYSFFDNVDTDSIVITHVNTSDRNQCLDVESWPDQLGWVDTAPGRVMIVVNGDRYPMRPFNMGYCIGDCQIRVEPNEQITASMPYSVFDLPPNLYDENKQLVFDVTTYEC